MNKHLMGSFSRSARTRGRPANLFLWILVAAVGSLPDLSSGAINAATKDQQRHNTIYHETEEGEGPPQPQQLPEYGHDPFHRHSYHNLSLPRYNDVATSGQRLGGRQEQQQMKEEEDIVELEATYINRGPFFDVTASKNVTALVGNTAYLNCRVHNLNNKTVSWIRHRDIHLLTTGKHTYTSDLRFQSIHNPQTEDWSLQVRYAQKRDSGTYECQVSTTPPIGHSMYLSVIEPITTLVGGPDLYINTGSTVNLTCIVQHSPEPPPAIKWMHNNAEINYDSPRGGVSVITEKGDVTTSFLLIQRARKPDSGKYTCSPSNANPVTVNVHILNGEHPAAMQRGGRLLLSHPLAVPCLALIPFLLDRWLGLR